jgi:hypothetical protein
MHRNEGCTQLQHEHLSTSASALAVRSDRVVEEAVVTVNSSNCRGHDDKVSESEIIVDSFRYFDKRSEQPKTSAS